MSQQLKFHRLAAGSTPTGGWKKGEVYFIFNAGSENNGSLYICKDTAGTLELYGTGKLATTAEAGLLSGTDKGRLDNTEVTTNKVTSLSSSSTDTQYPSAKATYDELNLRYIGSEPIAGTEVNPEIPVVMYIPQTLTDEQKAQVRTNIGAGAVDPTTITITSGGVTLTLQQWIDRVAAVTIDQ